MSNAEDRFFWLRRGASPIFLLFSFVASAQNVVVLRHLLRTRARVRKFLRHDAFLRNGLAVLHSMDADWLVVGLEFDLNNEDKVYDSIAILKHLALQLLNCIKIAIRFYQDKFCFKSRLQFFYLYLRINIFDKGSWFEFKWRGK